MPQKKGESRPVRPAQQQAEQPGKQHLMDPLPQSDPAYYKGTGKLAGKVAIITGGDSGIGRAVALLFAREGADVAIVYLDEHEDAEQTKELVNAEGRRCLIIPGDVGKKKFCEAVALMTRRELGGMHILVNNAAVQFPQEDFLAITEAQLRKTFETNIFGYFYLTQAVLPHLTEGDTIINTTSVTAYRGSSHLVDYASTKGAIVAFTRSLAQHLLPKKIRVNGVAPGPIWTPLIPSSFQAEQVASFGSDAPMGRVGEPEEVAPSYVFLASKDSSYFTGQILHPNGGEIVNG